MKIVSKLDLHHGGVNPGHRPKAGRRHPADQGHLPHDLQRHTQRIPLFCVAFREKAVRRFFLHHIQVVAQAPRRESEEPPDQGRRDVVGNVRHDFAGKRKKRAVIDLHRVTPNDVKARFPGAQFFQNVFQAKVQLHRVKANAALEEQSLRQRAPSRAHLQHHMPRHGRAFRHFRQNVAVDEKVLPQTPLGAESRADAPAAIAKRHRCFAPRFF